MKVIMILMTAFCFAGCSNLRYMGTGVKGWELPPREHPQSTSWLGIDNPWHFDTYRTRGRIDYRGRDAHWRRRP